MSHPSTGPKTQGETVAVQATGSEALQRALTNHPRVLPLEFEESASSQIVFDDRTLDCGNPDATDYGLIELMDNNPLVCSAHASTPGPAATLALVGMGPLLLSGVPTDSVSAVFSFESDSGDLDDSLQKIHFSGPIVAASDPIELGGVLAATFVAGISTQLTIDELTEMYDDAFGHSFFVRQSERVDPRDVVQTPFAHYTLSLEESSGEASMFQCQVIADAGGKCGAKQLVHMFNIMSGFEEDLGISN